MKHVYFLKYNNYANRIFKRGQALQDYLGVDNANFIAEIKECNMWNPNDGITTVLVTPVGVNFSVEPDYLIATDEYGTIDSRWFVTETIRLLRGQYRCHLKRDVFAEAWDELMDATCNIDRALLQNTSPLIFNPEPVSVNQIITDDMEIKDKTECPWIVFYGSEKPQHINKALNYYYSDSTGDIAAYANGKSIYYIPSKEDTQAVFLYLDDYDSIRRELKLLPYGLNETAGANTGFFSASWGQVSIVGNVPDITGSFLTDFTMSSATDAQEILNMSGSIVFDTTALKYYRVTVTDSSVYSQSGRLTAGNTSMFNAVKNIIANNTDIVYSGGSSIADIVPNNIWYKYKYKKLTMTYVEVTDVDTLYAQVPPSSQLPSDSPYFIWAMPYGNIKETIGTSPQITTDKDINLAIAMQFSAQNTQSKLYDFQIVPFCPLPNEFINPDGSITVDSSHTEITVDGTITKTINGVTTQAGHIYSIPKASFTKQILLENPITIDNPKLRYMTDLWRLSSPNYASSFEFSVAKNNGLTGFNVRCTYMPINPYIRVAPIFGGIYGSFFEENVRGLVCGGDYSMARIADAWVNYQEQNKNFEAIFNRQIDNMDVMRRYQRTEELVSAGVGVAGGAATGSMFGATAIGALGGIAAGAADLAISEGKYKESKSYATDMHKLELGNVQAMPRTLARTTAFNVDNRFFPVLTLYRCSSDELLAVCHFIQNRSMNVGIIDNPSNYINNTWSFGITEARGFIQGSIINIESVHDTHFVDELNDEFQKGVYLR